ncbi:XdhC family protein [Nafulsella turpanensis]|uniref:XdhC family protein n=1 Tax=Nafulsella turpanensis TaxID=1265690 RepID=UPI000349EA66|nr:XdhC/CoxI family protein [Nafulsella turpanensis]
MKEIRDIVEAYEAAQKEGKQLALATVVKVQGSSYRQPGARMLITEDGQLTGAISGGCLEGDALRKAQLVMLQQKPKLIKYDTMDEDDAQLGVGLGCNGIIHILIEPILPEEPHNPLQLLRHFLYKRQKAVLLTLFSFSNPKAAGAGSTLLLTEEGNTYGQLSAPELQDELLADTENVLQTGVSTMKSYTEKMSAFIEVLEPAVSLVIAGAGNDAIPLMKLATVLGWQTTLVDGRAHYATKARFPGAEDIFITKAEEALTHLSPDERTVFVLMTHNYHYDLTLLRKLLPLRLPYIGVLGPKKKLKRMLNELEEEGLEIDSSQLQAVFGPVGLDIGAESPEEIALSITAEIKAVLAGKKGNSLREKTGPIHESTTIRPAHETAEPAVPAKATKTAGNYQSCSV